MHQTTVNAQAGIFARAWLVSRVVGILALIQVLTQNAVNSAISGLFGAKQTVLEELSYLLGSPSFLISILLLSFDGRYNPLLRVVTSLGLLLALLSITLVAAQGADSVGYFGLDWRRHVGLFAFPLAPSKPIIVDGLTILAWFLIFSPLLKGQQIDMVFWSLLKGQQIGKVLRTAGRRLSWYFDILTNLSIVAVSVWAAVYAAYLVEKYLFKRGALGVALVLAIAFGLLLLVLTRYLKRRWRARADRTLSRDQRAPILLLRSFADDNARIKPKGFIAQLQRRKMRLEEIAASLLSPYGPFIALGSPGEKLPPLGAFRAYASDDQWQQQVLHWMEQSQIIFVIVGSSPSLTWELVQIRRNNYLHKLILVFPPSSAEDYRARLLNLSEVLAAGETWDLKSFEHTRAMHFAGSEAPTLIKSSRARQVDYELSLLTALEVVTSASDLVSELNHPRWSHAD